MKNGLAILCRPLAVKCFKSDGSPKAKAPSGSSIQKIPQLAKIVWYRNLREIRKILWSFQPSIERHTDVKNVSSSRERAPLSGGQKKKETKNLDQIDKLAIDRSIEASNVPFFHACVSVGLHPFFPFLLLLRFSLVTCLRRQSCWRRSHFFFLFCFSCVDSSPGLFSSGPAFLCLFSSFFLFAFVDCISSCLSIHPWLLVARLE